MISGVPAPFLDMAPAGHTAGFLSAGKSGREAEITSASEYSMHGAVGQRRHEEADDEPSAKRTKPGRPGDTSTATGTSPAFSVFGETPAPLRREKIRDICDPFHFVETGEHEVHFRSGRPKGQASEGAEVHDTHVKAERQVDIAH